MISTRSNIEATQPITYNNQVEGAVRCTAMLLRVIRELELLIESTRLIGRHVNTGETMETQTSFAAKG